MKITKFEDLEVWKQRISIAVLVYKTTDEGKFSKDFGLRDQVRRSVVSISANIVEGFKKNNNKEFVRYLKIAKGSTGEARNHLYIAKEVNYLNEDDFNNLNNKLMEVAKQLSGFIHYLKINEKK